MPKNNQIYWVWSTHHSMPSPALPFSSARANHTPQQ
jgi:hypothetical protein